MSVFCNMIPPMYPAVSYLPSRIDSTLKIFSNDLLAKVSHGEEPYESLTANYLPC